MIMDSLLTLLLPIGLVAIFFYQRSSSRKKRGDGHFDPYASVQQPTNRPVTRIGPTTSSTRRPASIPRPFDTESAREPAAKTVIRGHAYVVDGDTITINKTQFRLFGVDAPELNHPYGKKAKWELVSLCKGHVVRAEVIERDSHGRTVAHCTLPDGRDLSAEMVKAGLAIDWAKYSNGKYRSLEVPNARKKMWLADARQKGRMYVWEKFEARNKSGGSRD